MLNYIWAGMIFVSFIFSIFSGNTESVNTALITGAQDAVNMSIGLCGMICFWSGLLKIAEYSGLTEKISHLLSPLIKFLFPNTPINSKASHAMTMNMVANFLGLSNAATPLGLAAMRGLSEENGGSHIASDDMCMFVVINTASLTLIPTTLIALRAACGSENPFEILLPVWINSFITLCTGVISAKFLSKRSRRL